MTSLARIILASGKEHSLLRFHPWVFSGAIKRIEGEAQEGDPVTVHASNGRCLGTGHYTGGSIAVRLFAFEEVLPDYNFWKFRLSMAIAARQRIGLPNQNGTEVYRLVFAEGDLLPGLIVDVYGETAVLQAHTLGMYLIREQISEALRELLGDRLQAVYDKSAESLPPKSAADAQNGYLWGSSVSNRAVEENGHRFLVDWEGGQKTGFFIDQRDNRQLLAQYSRGKKVLNTFCYTGGFSVYAAQAGAALVHSVDSSRKAIALTDDNIALNGIPTERHESFAADVFDFLKENPGQYDIIILDPPAFAKHQAARHSALMGYKRLNIEALKQLKPGGMLFTFSCSGVVTREHFEGAVIAASIQAGRPAQILHRLSQPADHPVSIFHPEGEYLKGLVLGVE